MSSLLFAGCDLEEVSKILILFFLLLSHLGHAVNGSAMCCQHDVLFHHRNKRKGTNQSWMETSKIMNQNKPFLFIKYLLQVFVVLMES